MVKNKSKRKKVNKPTSRKYKFYKMEGNVLKRARNCPRCGPGIFLMETNNRVYCGKCHYTEFIGATKSIENTQENNKPKINQKPAKKK